MKNIDSALPRRTDCVFKSHDTCQLRSVADISRGIASNVVCHAVLSDVWSSRNCSVYWNKQQRASEWSAALCTFPLHAVVNVSLRPRFGAAHWSVTAFAWSTMSNCDVIDEIGITPPENVRATTPVKSLDKAALDPSVILYLQVTQLMPIVLFILCFYLLKYSKIYVLTTSIVPEIRGQKTDSQTRLSQYAAAIPKAGVLICRVSRTDTACIPVHG